MNTKKGVYGGRQNESPPTTKGLAQSHNLGKFIRQSGIIPTSVYSSPAVRAYETARISLEEAGVGVPIIETPELLELNRGSWTGVSRTEIAENEELQRTIEEQGMDYKPKGGESMREGFERITRFVDSTIEPLWTPENPQVIFVFSHSNIIGCLLAAIQGRERDFNDSYPIGEASMSGVIHDRARWFIGDINVNTQHTT